MNERIVDFIAALRGAGVRVSLAESADALRAVDQIGVLDRESFRLALKTTLIKDMHDSPAFEDLFPLYFSSGGPPTQPPQLTPEQQRALQNALRDALRQLSAEQLRDLLERLLAGRDLTRAELDALGQQAGLPHVNQPYHQPWISRRMAHALGLDQYDEALQAVLAELARRGLPGAVRQDLQDLAQENAAALQGQIEQYVGQQLARQRAEARRQEPSPGELMHRRFESLDEREREILRDEVRRLAARLRTRIALRRRRGKFGKLDAKSTLRANQRYGGVPIDLRLKRRRRKPRLTMICDLSTSMRPIVEFLLRLVYELQDQITQTHSFAFIDGLTDISAQFKHQRPAEALDEVLTTIRPGHYNTDLGHSLAELVQTRFETVDSRTTVIILGDGRNNYNDPRTDLLAAIKARAHRLIWLTPEPEMMWGEGDSDMLAYAPICHGVYQVANMAQLMRAVDQILAAGE